MTEIALERVEQDRIDYIQGCIDYIRECSSFLESIDAILLKEELCRVESFSIIEDDYQEFTYAAGKAHNGAMNIIQSALEARMKRDEEDAARAAEAEKIEKIRIEQEKKEIDLQKLITEQAAKNREAQEEQERIAKAKSDLEEEKRRVAAQPDKEKLIAYSAALKDLEVPKINTPGPVLILNGAYNSVKEICARITKYTDTL